MTGSLPCIESPFGPRMEPWHGRMPGQAWMKLGGPLQNQPLGGRLSPVPIIDHRSVPPAGSSLETVVYGDRPWRMRTAGAALATGLALGFQDTFEPRDPPPVVTPERRERPLRDRIVLYFHPQVPEATLVLIRSA